MSELLGTGAALMGQGVSIVKASGVDDAGEDGGALGQWRKRRGQGPQVRHHVLGLGTILDIGIIVVERSCP